MGSRFENFDIGRAVASFLKIKGIRNFPSDLNTDSVQPVIDISRLTGANRLDPPAAAFSTVIGHSGLTVGGTGPSVGLDLVGTQNASTVNITPSKVLVALGLESRIMSITAGLSYDAAGAAADAGRKVSALMLLTDPSGNLSFAIQEDFAIIENISPYSWSWTFPQGSNFGSASARPYWSRGSGGKWDGFVPPGWSCAVQINRQFGTGNWPANTSVDIYCSVAQRAPSGLWRA